MFGSYGVDQCLDLVETALKSGRGLPKPEGDDWLEGSGVALAMLDSGPPTEHRSGARDQAAGRRQLSSRGRLDRDGQRLDHVALPARSVGAQYARRSIAIINGDTDRTPYDTGTFASTGTVVAGQAVEKTAKALRDRSRALPAAMPAAMSRSAGCRTMPLSAPTARFRWPSSACGQEPRWAIASTLSRKAYLSPRWSASTCTGVRVAVHRVTGEIMILQSVHAADIGRLDQSDAVPRPDRRRDRHGHSAGRSTRRWCSTTTAPW